MYGQIPQAHILAQAIYQVKQVLSTLPITALNDLLKENSTDLSAMGQIQRIVLIQVINSKSAAARSKK